MGNGQTIQMFGVFRESDIKFTPPIYNKQWCAVPCPGGKEMGEFDENKIYKIDTNDEVYKLVVAQNAKFNRNDNGYILKNDVIAQFDTETTVAMTHHTGHGGTVFAVEILSIIAGAAACVCIMMCLFRCWPIESSSSYNPETESLLHDHSSKRGQSTTVI